MRVGVNRYRPRGDTDRSKNGVRGAYGLKLVRRKQDDGLR